MPFKLMLMDALTIGTKVVNYIHVQFVNLSKIYSVRFHIGNTNKPTTVEWEMASELEITVGHRPFSKQK